MMARYRKVENCGPVPYPDQSGRYLVDGEVVENDEANDWSDLVGLGFVVQVEEAAAKPPKKRSKKSPKKSAKPRKKAKAEEPVTTASWDHYELELPEAKAPGADTAGAVEEVSNVVLTADDGVGTEEVDLETTRESDS